MTTSKIIKSILFGALYSTNLLLALLLWLCGQDGNIMLGIFLIVFYRLSLWLTPFLVTVVCWIPLRPKVAFWKKLIFNLAHLVFCAILFCTCFLLFGNWF